MPHRNQILYSLALLALGYAVGTVDVFRLPVALGQAERSGTPDSEGKIRNVHRSLQEAMEQLRQEGNYETITEGINAFLVLSGGGNARQDLESGNGVDPETFGAIYAGKATAEIQELLGANDEGQITYNGKPITIYSRKRLQRQYAERLRIKDAGL